MTALAAAPQLLALARQTAELADAARTAAETVVALEEDLLSVLTEIQAIAYLLAPPARGGRGGRG